MIDEDLTHGIGCNRYKSQNAGLSEHQVYGAVRPVHQYMDEQHKQNNHADNIYFFIHNKM